jgi:hypothetical protein
VDFCCDGDEHYPRYFSKSPCCLGPVNWFGLLVYLVIVLVTGKLVGRSPLFIYLFIYLFISLFVVETAV